MIDFIKRRKKKLTKLMFMVELRGFVLRIYGNPYSYRLNIFNKIAYSYLESKRSATS